MLKKVLIPENVKSQQMLIALIEPVEIIGSTGYACIIGSIHQNHFCLRLHYWFNRLGLRHRLLFLNDWFNNS